MSDTLLVFGFCMSVFCFFRGAWAITGDLAAAFDTLFRRTRDTQARSRDAGLAQLRAVVESHGSEMTSRETRT